MPSKPITTFNIQKDQAKAKQTSPGVGSFSYKWTSNT